MLKPWAPVAGAIAALAASTLAVVLQPRAFDLKTGGMGTLAAPNGGADTAYLNSDTVLSLINATPYRWRRASSTATWAKACWLNNDCADSAGEVEYRMEGTARPASLSFRYHNRRRGDPLVSVALGGELAALGTRHELPFLLLPGGSGFVVAGTEGDFVSHDAPVGWMQEMLPELGNATLREVVLPRSHHAGLNGGTRLGLGGYANTQVQSASLEEQLGEGGVRVLDFRAARVPGGRFRECHIAKVARVAHGMLGSWLDDMVDAINRFNARTPGELVVLDVHDEALDATRAWARLDLAARRELFAALLRLEHRAAVPDDKDVSRWPLARLVGGGASAVLVNFHDSWRRDDPAGFPGGREGFVSGQNLPLTHRWSDTDSVEALVADQVRHFRRLRTTRDSRVHIADWILTQQGLTAVVPQPALIDLSSHAWRELYGALWDMSDSESYPNWIAVDHVQGSMHKAIVMAMNHCLVARRCGALGGKVKMPAPEP
ncbi:hypothetical protein ESCO_006180 [Escovopsis weberi]|uniref:PI-PLC X domain-containing protein 1 n=1 Tax=Escovopsis weberi TaxID=150374 RepID=A0A0M8MZU3_ESCWE|nr:hypothetical protein ESCO_006180 [Escovopsis weberi]